MTYVLTIDFSKNELRLDKEGDQDGKFSFSIELTDSSIENPFTSGLTGDIAPIKKDAEAQLNTEAQSNAESNKEHEEKLEFDLDKLRKLNLVNPNNVNISVEVKIIEKKEQSF